MSFKMGITGLLAKPPRMFAKNLLVKIDRNHAIGLLFARVHAAHEDITRRRLAVLWKQRRISTAFRDIDDLGRGVAVDLGEFIGRARSSTLSQRSCFGAPVMKRAATPCWASMIPSRASRSIPACRIVTRETPNSAASSSFAGNRSPCAQIPRATRCRKISAIWAYFGT